jgi:hypothetical protein
MSINDFMDKIKGHIGIDRTTLLCLCTIILVGFSCFGLGRLSVLQGVNNDGVNTTNNVMNISKNVGDSNPILLGNQEVDSSNIEKKKMYIASKNGKLYYTPSCGGAKRILPKNEIWFANSTEATQAGYTLSSSCK